MCTPEEDEKIIIFANHSNEQIIFVETSILLHSWFLAQVQADQKFPPTYYTNVTNLTGLKLTRKALIESN